MPLKKKGKRGKSAPQRAPSALTPMQERFALEYLVDLNGTQAAIRSGYSQRTANSQAAQLMANPKLQERIAELVAERSERTRITADKVLKRWWEIGTADANELTQLRRINCRHCWGIDHAYQWTEAEYERACAEARALARAEDEKKGIRRQFEEDEDEDSARRTPADLPSDEGGYGYLPNREPHPSCPECAGEGFEDVFFHDTRKLSPQAKLLYRGVKRTKQGLEIVMANQDDAILQVAKHLNMFKEAMPAAPQVNITNNTVHETTNVNVTVEKVKDELSEIFGDAARLPAGRPAIEH